MQIQNICVQANWAIISGLQLLHGHRLIATFGKLNPFTTFNGNVSTLCMITNAWQHSLLRQYLCKSSRKLVEIPKYVTWTRNTNDNCFDFTQIIRIIKSICNGKKKYILNG